MNVKKKQGVFVLILMTVALGLYQNCSKKNEDSYKIYSDYSKNTTKWIYSSGGGYGNFFTYLEYNKEKLTVFITWRRSFGDKKQCANNVFLKPNDLSAFFPETGLKYKVYNQGENVLDAGSSYLLYENDNGEWKFYIDKLSLPEDGGNVLESGQVENIRNAIERLIVRAEKNLIKCPEYL